MMSPRSVSKLTSKWIPPRGGSGSPVDRACGTPPMCTHDIHRVLQPCATPSGQGRRCPVPVQQGSGNDPARCQDCAAVSSITPAVKLRSAPCNDEECGPGHDSLPMAYVLPLTSIVGDDALANGHAPSIRGDHEEEQTWRKPERSAACRLAQSPPHSHFRQPMAAPSPWNNAEANKPSYSSFTAAGGDHTANGRWASWPMPIKTSAMPASPC